MTNISRIWLFLVREGGRWTTPEIAESLGMKPAVVMSTVNAMWLRKYVQRNEIPDRALGTPQFQYWVNSQCITPSGMLMQELEQAGLQFVALTEKGAHVR